MLTKSKKAEKKPDQTRRKNILESYGKFSNIKTSSESFAKNKAREIKRENN